jgi:iron complex transport system substrate-binding protein
MTRSLRIISLAPGQTEILGAVGLATETAGITENCDFPPNILGKRTYGSWFAPDLNGVLAAQPDLVCTFGKHQEEARETLLDAGLQVFHSDPDSVDSSLSEILRLAELTDREETGRDLVDSLRDRLSRVHERLNAAPDRRLLSVFRIMNWDPLITVGPGSFQHDVIQCAGGCNALRNAAVPYIVCTHQELRAMNPDAVFFCEPFIESILLSDPAWTCLNAIRNRRVFVFDCGLTCRSGPRIVDMVESLAGSLYPELFPVR